VGSSSNSDVGDIFVGFFLSLAGALVGSVIGTVALVLRMLPEIDLVELVVGFVAGFVVGFVIGFISMFTGASLAIRISRRHAQNIWMGTVAITAGIAAAVTAWFLIAV
jgi:hypothetical protein